MKTESTIIDLVRELKEMVEFEFESTPNDEIAEKFERHFPRIAESLLIAVEALKKESYDPTPKEIPSDPNAALWMGVVRGKSDLAKEALQQISPSS